jgi:acyl carrier protein
LGEIETALAALPGVKEAVVSAIGPRDGERRLVAYVVPESDSLQVSQLRVALAARLADYMVPSHFELLEALPLSANGKIDRTALPQPMSLHSQAAYVAPRTPTEQILASIFADVLKVDKVGVNDNFFELGGHSIAAVRILATLKTEIGISVPVGLLFVSPTIAQLAALVEEERTQAVLEPELGDFEAALTDALAAAEKLE